MDNQEHTSAQLYTPAQVAKRLGITTYQLRYLRQTGRIEGTFAGNTTLYTEEQIARADLSSLWSPGRKPSTSKKTLTGGALRKVS